MVEQVDHGFSIEKSDDGSTVRFSVNGAGIGGGAYFGLIFVGFLFGGIISLVAQNGAFFFVICGGVVGIAVLLDAGRKQLYEFEITPKSIRMPGEVEYNKSDISELLVRNESGKSTQSTSVGSSTVVVGGTGITGAAMVGGAILGNASQEMGAAAGQAISDSLAKRGYSVAIRHGRNVIPLARYLMEDDAASLFNKVEELFHSAVNHTNEQPMEGAEIVRGALHSGAGFKFGLEHIALVSVFILFSLPFLFDFGTTDHSNQGTSVSKREERTPKAPPSLGRYDFVRPFTHKVVVEEITPAGGNGPIRFWQCVPARLSDKGDTFTLRLTSGKELIVPATALEVLERYETCKMGRGYVPTERGYRYADVNVSYMGIQPNCKYGSNGRFWQCLR